jgi:prevent-host-death family protein
MPVWTLQDAKNRFSAVVRAALDRGPQFITRHGRQTVVVMAAEEYARLTSTPTDLVQALRESPLAEAIQSGELVLAREHDVGRPVLL